MQNHTVILKFSLTLLIIQLIKIASSNETNSTLRLVHVLFRHGDRTTDARTLYPKDPFINETYYPYGLGELTNKGKQKAYKVGKALRKRYGAFLGEIYSPDILEAQSSDTNRTKTSLQLVLTGLFPPVGDQIWESGLNWQPIPFNVLPRRQDSIFFGLTCSTFKQKFTEIVTAPKWQKEFKKHKTTFDYIAENTGLEVNNYFDVFHLYLCLTTEKEFGFTLPEWTKNVYPQPLKDFAIKTYELMSATSELRRLSSGGMLKKIVDDSKAKISGELVPKNRKIFLYSGHEVNLANMLHTLDVFEPQIPPYSSYILFELHVINRVPGFKIYYEDYTSTQPQPIKLPACDEFCPLDQFIDLLSEYFPRQDACNGNHK
ncbi:Venom acid phosphatase Acph-1-like Protein [Tribolium castaneum]|uniref:acid phosphatase n=1 Tax=Tribolium castaneum TaxID=7070 RepID=D2A1N0_TRICA|nr:PREDICTED: venom acid phosphatase Acph-1 [Tribolium castaneum]EFA02696.1 Venom acid phosphatase Acph-1-like Protein [Tribolium castaneum]|eukprot:XP_001811085.2 PREDICTED: venom acid phosphatase Acph-1 [Tribolium castaneum]